MTHPYRFVCRWSCLLAVIAFGGCGGCGDEGAGGGSIELGDASTMAGEPAGLFGITDLHNQARAMASPTPNPPLPPLTWSPTVAASAEASASRCEWSHSNSPYGENIYASGGFAPSAYDVVSDWVSEESDYHYSSNSCDGVCGHYTQVVWRDTVSLGCAIRQCTTGSPFGSFPNWTFVVCQYDPPGNYPTKPY